MKKFLACLSFLAINSQGSFAQTYYPIPTDGSLWEYYDVDDLGIGGFRLTFFDMVYAGSDSINGKLYSRFKSGYGWGNPGIVMGNIRIREENRKIYLYDLDSNENIIYDFNLNAGDTFSWFRPKSINPFKRVVQRIDSISMGGKFRRRIIFINDSWVEGIGNLGTFFTMPFNTFIGGISVCRLYDGNGTLLYAYRVVCGYTGITHPNESTAISVWPNPTQDVLNLNLTESNQLLICDITGKTVMNFKVAPGSNQLNVFGLVPGIYFCKIGENRVSTFVKQ